MTEKFVPAQNASILSKQCAAMIRASGDLIGTIASDLSLEKQQSLDRLLEGGGRVGLAVSVDRQGRNEISLIGIEREGKFLTLATVHTVGNAPEDVAH